MGENFQVHRAAVNAAKGIRQFQKADHEIAKDKADSAVRHFDKGLEFLGTAYDKDDMDGAAKHYDKALEHYDAALDELDA